MPRSLTKPLSHQQGSRVARPTTRPAPTGGWNARDPLAQMAPNDAQILDNMFPRESDVISRQGSLTHCNTLIAGPIARLIEFERYDQTHLIACGEGKLVDSATPTPVELGTGFASDYWTSATIANNLLLANGVDKMQRFDGTTLTEAAFTGIDTALLSFVHTHHNRIMAIEKNSQNLWVAEGVGTLAGAMSKFDLSLTGSFAGHLFAALTITRDGGSGPDDYLALLFSSGDCVIYSGTNPLNASNFWRVGHFKFGRPISRFGFADTGSDVMCVTERGYENVAANMPFGDKIKHSNMISSRIQNAVTKAIKASLRSGEVDDSWSITVHGKEQMMIVNVPQGSSAFVQHVMNINTERWGRFIGLKAASWGRIGTRIYLGDSTGRVKEYTGNNDDGRAIAIDVLTAWDSFGALEVNKIHKLQQIVLESTYFPDFRTALRCDYQPVPKAGNLTEFEDQSLPPEWDQIGWDQTSWATQLAPRPITTQNGSFGRVSALRFTCGIRVAPISWVQITYFWEPGGIL